MLSNEEKRQIYDQLGPDGLQQNEDVSYAEYANLNDILSSIFGDGMGGFSQRPTRTEDMVQRLPVTLDELYTGVRKDFAVNRNKICTECKGYVSPFPLSPSMGTTKPDAVKRCPRCNGKGFIIQTAVMMGMVTQTRTLCPECSGEGSSISSKDRCKSCRGRKIRREREEMSVTVRAGMSHGQKIVLRGAADQDPHLEAGDIVFYIDQIPHPVFRRRGNDLFVKQEVSLLESLTGASVTLDHLNGEKVRLVTQEGDLLAPGAVRCVDKLGMPLYNQPGAFGKLYVRFQVKFPTVLSKQQRDILRSVLAEQGEAKKPAAEKPGEAEKPAVEAKVETEKPKEEVKVETKVEAKEETEKPKEETKAEAKEETEKPKEETKKETEKETEKPKEESKEESKEEKAAEPDSVEYVLQDCDQNLYGNPKLWDVESNHRIYD